MRLLKAVVIGLGIMMGLILFSVLICYLFQHLMILIGNYAILFPLIICTGCIVFVAYQDIDE